jgi:dienelactone hydrolase
VPTKWSPLEPVLNRHGEEFQVIDLPGKFGALPTSGRSDGFGAPLDKTLEGTSSRKRLLSCCSRRRFLRYTAIAGGTALQWASIGAATANGEEPAPTTRRDVPWLEQVQRPPQRLPADAQELAPLLVDTNRLAIKTAAGWQRKRAQIAATWRKYLGSVGDRPDMPPKVAVLEEVRTDSVSRQLIRYEVEPGESTEAYLLRPAGGDRQRRAGVVVFHSTVDGSIRQPAGLGMHNAAEKAFGLHLAQRGLVALCPRNFLWPTTDKIDTQKAMRRFAQRHPGVTGMAKMLHDAQVAVDLLAAWDDVDRNRLAAVGHSLGAKEVLYLAAFDERIRCAVASEGGIGMSFSNWDAPWYLGPDMKRGLAGHEHHELLALAAPRAFLLVGGGTRDEAAGSNGADGARSWPFVDEALKVYRLLEEHPKLGLYNHHQGHSVPSEAADRIYEWLLTYV